MVGELDEFTMCSADVSELGGAELGEIGLWIAVRIIVSFTVAAHT